MRDANALASFEIYIPEEAEVKCIPLCSLMKSTLKRLGLAKYGGDVPQNAPNAPKAIWISPAIIRKRGHPDPVEAGDSVKTEMTSLVDRDMLKEQGPFQMPFVSSNCTAFKVLGEFLPTKRRQSTSTSQLPEGIPSGPQQDAVIIFDDRIYLSIKKPKLARIQGDAQQPDPSMSIPATQSRHIPLTTSAGPVPSPSASVRQKLSRPASPSSVESEFIQEKRFRKKHCLTHQPRVSLPKLSPQYLKKLEPKSQGHTTAEVWDPNLDLFNEGESNKNPCRGKEGMESKIQEKDGPLKQEAGVFSSVAHHAVSQAGEVVHKLSSLINEPKREDCCEKRVGKIHSTGHTQTEEEEIQPREAVADIITITDSEDDGYEEEENAQVNTSDIGLQVDRGEVDPPSGVKEEYTTSSCSAELSQVPTFSSSLVLPQDFDFEQLAQEEKISHMKAKLREREAALKNL